MPVGGVTDVQVDGKTVVVDNVANIPIVTSTSPGITPKIGGGLKISRNSLIISAPNSYGMQLWGGDLGLFRTSYQQINDRAPNQLLPIQTGTIDYAVKAAMCDGKGDAWTDTNKTGAWKRLSNIKMAMDDVAISGASYYLGEQTNVAIVLPDTANVGQIITVCWYNGATAATLSITGTMLDFDYAPSANTRSEINALWDGLNWAVLGNEMGVPSE